MSRDIVDLRFCGPDVSWSILCSAAGWRPLASPITQSMIIRAPKSLSDGYRATVASCGRT